MWIGYLSYKTLYRLVIVYRLSNEFPHSIFRIFCDDFKEETSSTTLCISNI
jgi:hypothetical protein